MSKQSLPVVDPSRLEFGLSRTQCACPECILNCHHVPGYLVPADLDRIHKSLASDEDLFSWAKRHLLASPGAIVARRGQAFRIPTLVPARRLDGACLFLTAADDCAIHAVSPFGCAFFDSHMARTVCDQRSLRGLQAVAEDWAGNGLYARTWLALASDGLVAPPPEIARRLMRRAISTVPIKKGTSDACQ